jgi:hypothetical protein
MKKSVLVFLLVILSLLAVSPGAFAAASPLAQAHWRSPFSIKSALATTAIGGYGHGSSRFPPRSKSSQAVSFSVNSEQ